MFSHTADGLVTAHTSDTDKEHQGPARAPAPLAESAGTAPPLHVGPRRARRNAMVYRQNAISDLDAEFEGPKILKDMGRMAVMVGSAISQGMETVFGTFLQKEQKWEKAAETSPFTEEEVKAKK